MKRLTLTLVLLLSVAGAWARNSALGKWDTENRHSVSLSMGNYAMLWGYIDSQRDLFRDAWDTYPEDDVFKTSRTTSPLFSAAYTYRVSRLFSISCDVSYLYENTHYEGMYDDKYSVKMSDDVFLVTPSARLHWLNTDCVELYSAIGFGVGYSYTQNEKGEAGKNKWRSGASFQWTPIGISGKIKKFNIFGEIGVGTLGTFRLGVARRF